MPSFIGNDGVSCAGFALARRILGPGVHVVQSRSVVPQSAIGGAPRRDGACRVVSLPGWRNDLRCGYSRRRTANVPAFSARQRVRLHIPGPVATPVLRPAIEFCTPYPRAVADRSSCWVARRRCRRQFRLDNSELGRVQCGETVGYFQPVAEGGLTVARFRRAAGGGHGCRPGSPRVGGRTRPPPSPGYFEAPRCAQ